MPAAFPVHDPVGPHDQALSDEQARQVLEHIAEGAADADRHGVRREALDALAGAGLLGRPLTPVGLQRELTELLAGSDASTWFCWVQHQTPMRVLGESSPSDLAPCVDDLQARLLPGMASGEIVNAVAFAHIRRPGTPNPLATRVEGGWVLEGTLDWVTSWDIADVVMIMAQAAAPFDDYLVCAYLPAGAAGERADATPGVTPGDPLQLLSMSGTHTRPIALDRVRVNDAQVGAVIRRDDWLTDDAQRTADPNPAAFGLARASIAELSALAAQRGDETMNRLAVTLVDECRDVRSRAYAVMEDEDRDGTRPQRLVLRAQGLELAVRAATAVVTARAGAAMLAGTSAERRIRESMFLQVQAQTADTRAASLALLSDP